MHLHLLRITERLLPILQTSIIHNFPADLDLLYVISWRRNLFRDYRLFNLRN